MGISELYNKIALSNPRMEVALRTLYWKNYKFLNRFKPKRNIRPADNVKIDFDKIIDYLKSKGVGEGTILIVHSSYGALKGTGLTPDQIVEKLLSLVGTTGTLAMPVIRRFEEEPAPEDELKSNLDDVWCTYDVRNTKIVTGALCIALHKRSDSVTSRFPLNPMCAVGKNATDMIIDNINGMSPHDNHSSWKYCYDHNAIILGLGIDLAHYLTMIHVAEEAFPDWPIKDWFRKRNFIIKDGEFEMKKTVLERRPKWGMLHLADKLYTKDFKDEGILVEKTVESTMIGLIESQKLIPYLNSRKSSGYPYIVKKKDMIDR